MGLFIFSELAAAGTPWQTCSNIVFSLLKQNRSPNESAPAGPRDAILNRFNPVGERVDFEWSARGDALQITFADNRQKMNETLLSVVSVLALAYDGREFVYRDSFVPVKSNEDEPLFVLRLDIHLAPTPTELANFTQRRLFGQGPQPKKLIPRSHVMDYDYVGFASLLLRADRMAFSEGAVNVTSLRVQADRATMGRLRDRLRELLPARLGRQLTGPGATSRSEETGTRSDHSKPAPDAKT